MEQVEDTLRVLYSTSDAQQRQTADAWLREFQASQAAWEIAVGLLTSGHTADSKLFGATVLCTKLRGDNCGGLPPESAAILRSVLLQHLGAMNADSEANLHAQLCRACSLLLGNGGVGSLVSDPAFASLGAAAMLAILALIPEAGAFLSDAETVATQLLLLTWLQHAYVTGAPFPPALPASAAPTDCSDEYRLAVLEAACKWAEMPASDGITLGRLAASPCSPELMRHADLRATPVARAQTSFYKEARLVFELFRLVLDQEPSEEVAGVGSRLPSVPPSALGELVASTMVALEPLVVTADMAHTLPSGEEDVDDDEEDESEEEAGVMLAAVGLGGALLSRASAYLAPSTAADEAGQRLSHAMLQLLQSIVPCSTHCKRAVCEGTIETGFWPSVLRAAAGWESAMRAELLTTAARACTTRATFPPEQRCAQWGSVELLEYCEFRDNYLREAISDLARAAPTWFVQNCVAMLRDGDASARGRPLPWQAKEAALFAATASVEVLLSRVLAPPGAAPPAGAAELSAWLPPLLEAALTSTASSSSAACEALMIRARCELVESLTPWLALDPAAHGLAPALTSILPAISYQAPVTADAALSCLTQLCRRCAVEMSRDELLIQALLDMLSTAFPLITDMAGSHSRVERRCGLLTAVGGVIVEAPAAVERFFAPVIAALEHARAGLQAHAAATRSHLTAAAHELAARLDETAAALAPLKPLPKPNLVALLTHLWPTWGGLMGAAVAAHVEAEVHPALCRFACEAVRSVRAEFAPLLPETVASLTAAFSARPSACLLSLADALVEAFGARASSDVEASFASLIDQLAARAFAAIAPDPSNEPALLSSLLSHADTYAKLLVPAIAAASALPSLLNLAATVLGTCREAEPCDAAMSFLCSVGAAARTLAPSAPNAGSTHTAEGAHAIRTRLQLALASSTGRAILRGCIIGLADTLPEPSLPCVAECLAPLLHLESWRADDDGLAAWALDVLTELPATEGAPDARCRQTLHQILTTFPDACSTGARYHKVVGILSKALVDFGKIARRKQSANGFVLDAYDWSDAAMQKQQAGHSQISPGFGRA